MRIASIVRNTGASSAQRPAAPVTTGRGRDDEVEERRRPAAREAAGGGDGRVELAAIDDASASIVVVIDAGGPEPRGVDDERVARLPTPAARRSSGSAGGRPRSGRATGRWSPRR